MKVTQEKTKELVVDLLTTVGQADIALTQAREAILHPQLDKGFVSSLKSLNKKRGADSSRFKANRLFHEDLDTVVTRRSKESKLSKVLASSSSRRYNNQGRTKWSKESRWTIIPYITFYNLTVYLW